MANDVLGFHTNLLTDCQFMKPKTSSETSMKLFQKSHALSSSSHNISPGLCHQRPNFAESYILILLFSLVTFEQNIYVKLLNSRVTKVFKHHINYLGTTRFCEQVCSQENIELFRRERFKSPHQQRCVGLLIIVKGGRIIAASSK